MTDAVTFTRIERLWRPEIVRLGIPSIGRLEAELLATLAAATGARRVLEVGTAIGYSAAYLAAGAGPEATVDAVELSPRRAEVARRLWREVGLDGRVRLHESDALSLLPTLAPGYDLVFVDLLWEIRHESAGRALALGVLGLLRAGGTLVADNCGQGIPAADGFIAEVASACPARALLPLRDGVLVAVKADERAR